MYKAPVKVFSQFDRPQTVATSSGDKYEDVYELCRDEDGVEFLKATGEKVDLQAKINANMGITFFDLAEAYSRYLNGDADALVLHPQCFYGDVSEINDLLSVVKANEQIHVKIAEADAKFAEEQSVVVSDQPEQASEAVADV